MFDAFFAKYFFTIILCITIPARLQNGVGKFRAQTSLECKTVPAQIWMKQVLTCANDNFEQMFDAFCAKYFCAIILCITTPARPQNGVGKFRAQTSFECKTVPAQIWMANFLHAQIIISSKCLMQYFLNVIAQSFHA